jgi:hypothetical protein
MRRPLAGRLPDVRCSPTNRYRMVGGPPSSREYATITSRDATCGCLLLSCASRTLPTAIPAKNTPTATKPSPLVGGGLELIRKVVCPKVPSHVGSFSSAFRTVWEGVGFLVVLRGTANPVHQFGEPALKFSIEEVVSTRAFIIHQFIKLLLQ